MNRSNSASNIVTFAIVTFVVVAWPVESSADVVIETVPVGNAGGGGVSYKYNIGKYEVTNAQYTEFLNAVDPSGTNTLALYSINMSNHANGGGINFLGNAADESKYSVETGRDNNPVIGVSWYDTVRFVNWLHNGPGSVSTETGAYTLLGGTAQPANGSNITRNAGATWFLPNETNGTKQPITRTMA